MDEKEAEARPIMGTIFLVFINILFYAFRIVNNVVHLWYNRTCRV